MRITWDQVFGWRLRRQYVSEPATGSVPDIVGRLCGVQAQVTSSAETAVALRRHRPDPGALVRELAAGTLVKTWSMRGTLHALTPAAAAVFLPLIASARIWEKPAWQRNFGATPTEVVALTEAVSRHLADAVLTREELIDALSADSTFHRMGEQLRSGWGALLKPLAWQGALCHGPAQGNRATFTSPAHLIPDWPGLLEPDIAAPAAITAYLGAYGAATPESFDAWLTRASLRKTTVRRWFADLGDAMTEVEVEGRRAYIPTEHVDELAASTVKGSVYLLGAFDQYVLGPGTADTALLPAAHRSKVSRAAGWIAPLVLVDGRIAGTWELTDGDLTVSTFDNADIPAKPLDAAVARVAVALGLDALAVRTA
ncbi:winged helix DNA-binding domain-containing protein [Nocardia sp. NPDC005366]|uniref:winged helix DNA-binding domain-containing protein n=1 Tax=Nocardia sp. NPDC005366 TaxID=3156878 RepID=UPI0033B30159